MAGKKHHRFLPNSAEVKLPHARALSKSGNAAHCDRIWQLLHLYKIIFYLKKRVKIFYRKIKKVYNESDLIIHICRKGL